MIQLNCGKFSSYVISTTGFFKIRMVNLDISTICNGQNIGCRPDILTANQPLSLHYFVLLLKPFSRAYWLAFCLRSSLYGGCKRMDSRDLSIK